MKSFEDLLAIIGGLSVEERSKLQVWLGSYSEEFEVNSVLKVIEIKKQLDQIQKPVCIYCGADSIQGYGKTSKGLRRFKCTSCVKYFNELTGTTVAGLRKRDLWLPYIQRMIKGYTLQQCADELKITLKTSFLWRHKILNAFKDAGCAKLEGLVESDETFFLYSEKGQKNLPREGKKRGGKASTDGITKEHVSVLITADRNKHITMNVAGRGRLTKAAIHEAAGKWFSEKITLITDRQTNFHFYAKDNEIDHVRLFMRKKEYVKEKVYHIQNVNNLHSRFKKWMRKFNGVASKYLQHYVDFFRMIEFLKQNLNQTEFLKYSLIKVKPTV